MHQPAARGGSRRLRRCPLLTAAMIVRNEERHLPHYLASLEGVVDWRHDSHSPALGEHGRVQSVALPRGCHELRGAVSVGCADGTACAGGERQRAKTIFRLRE